MKKSDITYHHIGYGSKRLPAVNVKCGVYGFSEAKLRAPAGDVLRADDVDGFIEWWNTLDNNEADRLINVWWEVACESGWEMIRRDAKEIFGDRVEVWSEGRSGGWAVVEHLEDVHHWDAIMLGKWAKFVRWTKDVVDDIPYQIVWGIAANVYEPILEQQNREAALDAAARLPILLSGV